MTLIKLIVVCILLNQIFCSEKETKLIRFLDSYGVLHDLENSDQIGVYTGWTAWAQYENSINKTGWAQLEITSNGLLDNELQAYSSGLIEGYLTSDLIQYNWDNNIKNLCDNQTDDCNLVFAFIQKNIEFTKSQIEKFGETDPYWHQIKLSLIQLTGIEDGYRAVQNEFTPLGPRVDVNPKGLILLNLITEIQDLFAALNPNRKVDFTAHCSAIIKVLEDGSDLLVAHNSWAPIAWMVRILKRYNFDYNNINGKSVSFSSYPGVIFSVDDFYLLSTGLTVLETSISNFNRTLWPHVVADKIVFEFIRNTVANRLARNGKEWTQVFSKYNSGTYNNQFMIVDYNKFERGVHPSNLSNDLLWVLEQMPGYTEAADKTDVLRRQHYWPSYNIPYFKTTYDLSGYGTYAHKFGDFFTYNGTPRAHMFKRDQMKAIDISSLYKLMRFNDFKNDPFARCEECDPPFSAMNAIAARGDLDDPKGHYPNPILGFQAEAAIDVKITTAQLFSKLEMIANSGPTYDTQPPFLWSKTRLVGVHHTGQPDLFKFPAVHVKWTPPAQNEIKL